MKDLMMIFAMCDEKAEVLAMVIVLLVLYIAIQIAFCGAGLLFGIMALPTFIMILIAGAKIHGKLTTDNEQQTKE